MPSTTDIEQPPQVRTVALRYLRRERPLSALVGLGVASVFIGTFLVTSLLPAVGVGALLVIVIRAPLIQSHGTVRLRTDAPPDTVVDSFTGPTPPVLALHWGIADEITTGDRTATYRTSYLFGLRSTELTVETRTERTSPGEHRVTLELTSNDRPWATYSATITRTPDQTRIAVTHTSDRRFGLRRLPQWIVAERYRAETLTAHGYTVVERDTQIGI